MALTKGASHPLAVPFASTGLTVSAFVRKDGGAFAPTTNAVTEDGTTSLYVITITAAEMDADSIDVRLVPSSGTPIVANLITDPVDVVASNMITPQNVWEYGARSLTSVGTLVSDIWSHVTRGLTDKTGFSGTATNMVESAPSVASIRTELDANSTRLANLDTTISSRLATSGYTAPPSISGIATQVADIHTDIGTAIIDIAAVKTSADAAARPGDTMHPDDVTPVTNLTGIARTSDIIEARNTVITALPAPAPTTSQVAAAVLVTPANKLATDVTGRVTPDTVTEAISPSEIATAVVDSLILSGVIGASAQQVWEHASRTITAAPDGLATVTDITDARDAINSHGDANWASGITQEQIDSMSEVLAISLGADLAEEVTTGIFGSFVFTDAMRLGRGTGSQEFNDVVLGQGNISIESVVVRAFNRADNTVDWTKAIARDVTVDDGSYKLFLDPGTYELSMSLRGNQIGTTSITVV